MTREIFIRGKGPNTLSSENLSSLLSELDEAGDEPLLISGAGNAFCAGLDTGLRGVEEIRNLIGLIDELVRRLFLHPAPTVAAINGHAIAGGCLLAQACDQRILCNAQKVRIGMPGVALGILYPPQAVALLRYRIPAASLETILLGADLHDPDRALTLGLVDMVADDAHACAREMLGKMSAHPKSAYAEAKRALRAGVLQVGREEADAFQRDFASYWNPERMTAARLSARAAAR